MTNRPDWTGYKAVIKISKMSTSCKLTMCYKKHGNLNLYSCLEAISKNKSNITDVKQCTMQDNAMVAGIEDHSNKNSKISVEKG